LIREKVISDPPSAEERELIARAVPLIQERLQTLDEAAEQLRFLFTQPEPTDKAKAFLIPKNSDVLERVLRSLDELQSWDAASIRATIEEAADVLEVKRKDAFQMIRAAITYSTVSPPLFESMELLGRDRSLERLRAAIARAKGRG
jgi:glutamyl-tRNA synthetase